MLSISAQTHLKGIGMTRSLKIMAIRLLRLSGRSLSGGSFLNSGSFLRCGVFRFDFSLLSSGLFQSGSLFLLRSLLHRFDRLRGRCSSGSFDFSLLSGGLLLGSGLCGFDGFGSRSCLHSFFSNLPGSRFLRSSCLRLRFCRIGFLQLCEIPPVLPSSAAATESGLVFIPFLLSS